jgi:beta-lactamase regulating signal transducer with metallopeptidase domain
MTASDFWPGFLAQTLLRGAAWLLLLLLLASGARRLSAAGRALGWQMGFVGLLFLPALLLLLPPLPLLPMRSEAIERLPAPQTIRVPPAPSPTAATMPPLEERRAASAAPAPAVAPPSGPASRFTTVPLATVAVPQVTTIVVPQGRPFPWQRLSALVWASGFLWFMGRLALSLVALRRLSRATVEATGAISDAAGECANRLGMRRSVTVRFATAEGTLHAPITWGIRRPVVLLPAAYADATPAHRDAALLHEVAHVQRNDWAWLVLAQSLCAVYWCVPFVWMAARRLSRETELACDDCVLSAGISAPDYAAQILEVVRNMQTENNRLPLVALPMARPPVAETRIRAILDTGRDRRAASRSLLSCAALLLALVIPALALRAVAASEPPTVARVKTPPPAPPFPTALRAERSLTPPALSVPALRIVPPLPSVPADRLSRMVLLAPTRPLPLLRSEPGPMHTAAPAETVPAGTAIVWGPIVNGLQAGLRLAGGRTSFAPGEPIWQETFLRNTSPRAVTVQAVGYYEEQGAPRIRNSKGVAVKVLRYFGMGSFFVVTTTVGPGEVANVGRVALAFHAPDKDSDDAHEVAPGISSLAEGMPIALAGPDRYTLEQELLPRDSEGKSLNITLRTGALSLRVENVAPVPTPRVDHNKIADITTAPIAWGPERSGLQVGLYVLGERKEFFVGERVRVAVILRNVSKAPISFRHQTSFAWLDPPKVTDADGKPQAATLAPETEWRSISAIRMTGVTFDMTSAPSADGPSRLRTSEIAPGQSVLGYALTAFVAPARWKDGKATPGRYQLSQPFRVGVGEGEGLETTLETGGMQITLSDPDAGPARR